MAEPAQQQAQEAKPNFIVQYFKDFAVLKETRSEYWGLQAINMLDCLAYFAMFNIAVVTLTNDWGFNDVQAGLIYTLFSSLTTIFLFISGVMTDWLGIKRALYVSVIGLLLLRVTIVVSANMVEPVRLYDDTPLASLHDGEGVPTLAGGADLEITAHDGTRIAVDLSKASTIGEVLAAIDAAPGNNGKVEASLSPGNKGIRLDDNTAEDSGLVGSMLSMFGDADYATTTLSVAESSAAMGLGLVKETEQGTLIGAGIITALNNATVAELNRGKGLKGASTLTMTDRSGSDVTVADLGSHATLRGLIEHLNTRASEAGVQLEVGINGAGTGLRFNDKTGLKDGELMVSGDAAEALHCAGSEPAASLSGASLVANPVRNWLVILALAAMAPFMSMLQTVFQAANRRFTTKRSRGAGFNLWYMFMNVGAMGGGLLIDIIYLNMGLPQYHVFTFGIFTGVLCVVLIFLTIKNTDQLYSPEELAEEEAREAALSEEERAAEAAKQVSDDARSPLDIVKAVFSEPVFWRFTLLITLLLGVRAVFLYLGLLHPKFWYRVIGPDAQVGMLQAFNPFLVIFGLIILIPILEKFNVYKMLVFGAMITSISMFIIAIPPFWFGVSDVAGFTYGTTIVFLLVLTIGELIWSPRLQEYTAAIAPEGQEGTYLGLSMVPYFLAKLIVAGLSGKMLQRWCPEPPEENPLQLQEIIATGDISFMDSPYMMFTILGIVAIVGTTLAILGKPFFTKGARF